MRYHWHDYGFNEDFATPNIPQKYGAPIDIYISVSYGLVLLSPSLSFTVTIMVFRITTLTIPHDSDDYAMDACIYITFFLCPRQGLGGLSIQEHCVTVGILPVPLTCPPKFVLPNIFS
jgi:hypothetical protein